MRGVRRDLPAAVVLVVLAAWVAVFVSRTTFTALDGSRAYCLFDDAMVSMRHAWNLVHGDGLVWNPGERVEGYSNLLQTLLMAACIAVFGKLGGVLAVQVMGVVVLVVFGVFALRYGEGMSVSRGLQVSAFWRAMYLVAALAYYPLAYWTLLGMETGLVAAAVLAAAWYALTSPPDRVSRALVVACGIAVLARPDALLAVALVLVFRIASAVGGRGDRRRWRSAAMEAAFVGAVVAAAVAFRVLYYGQWTPNTYTLKIEGYSLAFRLSEGRAFIAPFLKSVGVPLLIAALGLALRPSRWVALPLSLFTAAVAYQVWVGGDAWQYWRLLAGSVPLLLLVALVEARSLVTRVSSSAMREGLVAGIPAVVALWQMNARFGPEIVFAVPPYEVEPTVRAARTGLALKEATLPSATVGVFRAGALVYFAERRGVDFLGKSDPHVARLQPDISSIEGHGSMRTTPGHNKYDLTYSILARRPTYVEKWWWGSQDLTAEASALYVRGACKGARLHLLKGSPDVRWDVLDAVHPLMSPLDAAGR